MRIMDVVGVSRLEDMKGKYIRVATKGWGSTVKSSAISSTTAGSIMTLSSKIRNQPLQPTWRIDYFLRLTTTRGCACPNKLRFGISNAVSNSSSNLARTLK